MSGNILVPLDGSPLAEQAIPFAAMLARAGARKLILVRAVMAHTLPGAEASEAQVNVVREAESDLDGVAGKLRGEGLDAEPCVYYDEPRAAILDAAKRRQAEMIVMSTHGRGGLGRWVYGSVADSVLREAEVPVFLIPAHCECTWQPNGPSTILVPLDGSALSEEALRPAMDLARTFRAKVLLVRVVEPPNPAFYGYGETYAYLEFDPDAALADARRHLAEVGANVKSEGIKTEILAAVGYSAPTIAMIAREQAADTLVMATHGRGGLARLVMGSVATGVLQRTCQPLLLIRPKMLSQARPPTSDAEGERQVNVQMTSGEFELVERSLRMLIEASRDEQAAGSAEELLTRLQRLAPVAPPSSKA